MKFVSYSNVEYQERLGLYIDDDIYDLKNNARNLSIDLPATMGPFLAGEREYMDRAREVHRAILDKKTVESVNGGAVMLLSPVPHPTSCRDAYAFRQHVATARRNRGLEMIEEFDQFPVFYFTNHQAVGGPGDVCVEQDHLEKLDFELEAAIVIGKRGRNISAQEADDYIAGYMIMNDLSARRLQMEEMRLNLGPAKGKDFSTTLGPWLVTPDELAPHAVETERGRQYNLAMKAYHNDELISEGNMKEMNWTFAEIIERVSYGVDIFPGDVIGSGTVGTGCYLELNGTRALEAKERGESYEPIWLKDGDAIELEIDGLGRLENKIVNNAQGHSILAKKKNV